MLIDINDTLKKLSERVRRLERRGLGGGSSYLVYTALLSQSGTDAPVATVLENTIGAIVWTYENPGTYFAHLAGAFPVAKTQVFITKTQSGSLVNSLNDEDNEPSDNILVNTTNLSGTNQDGWLYLTSIEIRVYP